MINTVGFLKETGTAYDSPSTGFIPGFFVFVFAGRGVLMSVLLFILVLVLWFFFIVIGIGTSKSAGFKLDTTLCDKVC